MKGYATFIEITRAFIVKKKKKQSYRLSNISDNNLYKRENIVLVNPGAHFSVQTNLVLDSKELVLRIAKKLT